MSSSDISLNIRVIPNAKKTEIKIENNSIKIKLNSPAEGGRANKELIKFLSKLFEVSKSQVNILKGEKSRDKIIKISGYRIIPEIIKNLVNIE